MNDFSYERVIRSIENRARRAQVSISQLCELADIAPSSFNRWKYGLMSPTLLKLERIDQVLKKRGV